MSYSYMSCVNNDNKCQYNNIEFNKYFDYLKTLEDDDSKLEKLNEFVCQSNKGELKECCNPKETEVIDDKYIKKVDNGYQICKCKDEQCKNTFCNDFTRPSKYQLCQTKTNKNKKINSYVYEINTNDFVMDCLDNCN